ncbi:MAG: hypothetical protein A2255_04660 [Candidatus Melainabacteria bacterium RIFOXYA2_FULL_32_9]|nr:MAG: hypothetical protein A2255_04660 [Candidatus Melainabacteria bacterium RIFOXYA2_FULL_32_9]
MKNKIFIIALALLVSSTPSVLAKSTTVQEIQDLPSKSSSKATSDKSIPSDHWAYKTLEDISKKYGLLMGKPTEKFNGSGTLTRNEAAFIFVNLIGKIEKDQVQLSESEKTRLEILKQELKGELGELTSKVASLETSVDSLKGSVSNLEEENKKDWKFDYGEKFKINGGLQAQFTGNFKKGDDQYPSNFALPYSEIRFSGKMNPKVGYVAALVPTRAFDGSEKGVLREAYATLDVIPHHTVYLGQNMVPIGYEGPQNPMAIETIDKAQMSRKLTDMPDLGVKAEGNWDFFSYSLGAYNGNGQNTADSNSHLALASWATVKPLYKYPQLGKLELGGGCYTGNNGSYNKDILSFYSGYKLKKFALWGEYLTANGYLDSKQKADSFYLHSSYYLTNKLQLLARFDQFDPNTKVKKNLNREYTVGGNYLLRDNLSLMMGLVQVANQEGRNSQRLEALTQIMF